MGVNSFVYLFIQASYQYVDIIESIIKSRYSVIPMVNIAINTYDSASATSAMIENHDMILSAKIIDIMFLSEFI